MSGTTDRDRVRDWWRTDIIDMSPGVIRLRGYAIQDLIGKVSYPEMVWLMLRGDLPTRKQARLLEAALVASVDHGPQSPAIAISRMAITSGNDINHAMGSAINVLGDTHGGAGQQCMELFADIETRQNAGDTLEKATADALEAFRATNGKHIPGFGHRFHPIDPRVEPLLALIDLATKEGAVSGRFAAIGRAVIESLARGRKRPIPMNIDGVTAVMFCELGFKPALGRGLFILSRAVGILAHAWEQAQHGERIKGPTPPDFLYTYEGEAPRSVPGRDGDGTNC
jgi:citrate synthase